MRRAAVGVVVTLLGTSVLAQRPSDPALLVPEAAPELDYVVAPTAVTLPAGNDDGGDGERGVRRERPSVGADARRQDLLRVQSRRHVHPKSFGDKLFTRSHGLRIDREGNLWATDVGGHVVMKLTRDGQPLLTIGTRGEAGEWNEAAGSRKLNQPNDVVIAANGDVFVAQGHTPGPDGDARVLKFDKTGKFIKSWGGKGSGPGQFQVAHGIAIDAKGLLWVADRENQRIQVFDQDGKFVREIKYKGLPCSLDIGRQYIYMVNGFAGQVLRLDLNGKVLAAIGKPGKGPGRVRRSAHDRRQPEGRDLRR